MDVKGASRLYLHKGTTTTTTCDQLRERLRDSQPPNLGTEHSLQIAANRPVRRATAYVPRRATIPDNRPTSPELRLARLELVLELPDQGALGGALGGVLGGVSAMAAHDDCRLAMDGALKAWIPGPLGRTQGEHDFARHKHGETDDSKSTTAAPDRQAQG